MTYEEAAAIVALMGWELDRWQTGKGSWWYDVRDRGQNGKLGAYIRNSAAHPEPDAQNLFIEWVEHGARTDEWSLL